MKSIYKIKWMTIDKTAYTKDTFEADSVANAVEMLAVELKSKNILAANIEIAAVIKDDEDLGIDGVLEAETALQAYY